MKRRQLLALAGAASGLALAGCEAPEQRLTTESLPPEPLPPPSTPHWTDRLVDRVSFGPRPGEIERVESLGLNGYVEEQLHPERFDATGVSIPFVTDPKRPREDPRAIWRVRALGDTLTTDTGLLLDQDDHQMVSALREATILRAVYSRCQLRERMVEFWGDHFNIYAFKGQGPTFKVIDDQSTIRHHALGRFRDLLGASARSAAMLGYLDNTVNRKGVPNENYARELMELHTLGVNGGYNQHDVKEVARCLTGWTLDRGAYYGQFKFNPSTHDDGVKHVLGHTIPAGGGIRDGETVLDIVAAHPSTARHLSRKLCIYFFGEAPDEWVKQLAAVFLRTRGDIRSLVRTILTSPDLQQAKPILKRPFDYVVSAMRALNVDTDGGKDVQAHLERMGQPLFAWPMPDGFPRKTSAWTGTLIPRWNFAMSLCANAIKNTTVDWKNLESCAAGNKDRHLALAELAFGRPARDANVQRLAELQTRHPDPAEFTSVLLMSPEFQWR